MTPSATNEGHLVWKRTTVCGRSALYGVAGEGLPVLFLHGWGLGQHAYKRALKRLAQLGCQVFAPAMPGFGGTPGLPGQEFSFAGFGDWAAAFLDALEVTEPVFLVGHSFGGGVAIALAHDHPERVRSLVLVNSVGGSAWTKGRRVRSMAERPLWDWGLHFPGDVMPLGQLTRVLPVVLEDALPNMVRDPVALWRVAQLARQADLTTELEELKRRQLPVVVLWGDKDKIIPRASFDALCIAIGSEGQVISGNHSWLLADPDAFGEVMTNAVSVAQLARQLEIQEPAAPPLGRFGRAVARATRRRRQHQPRQVASLARTDRRPRRPRRAPTTTEWTARNGADGRGRTGRGAEGPSRSARRRQARPADAKVASPARDAGGVELGQQRQGVLARRPQRVPEGRHGDALRRLGEQPSDDMSRGLDRRRGEPHATAVHDHPPTGQLPQFDRIQAGGLGRVKGLCLQGVDPGVAGGGRVGRPAQASPAGFHLNGAGVSQWAMTARWRSSRAAMSSPSGPASTTAACRAAVARSNSAGSTTQRPPTVATAGSPVKRVSSAALHPAPLGDHPARLSGRGRRGRQPAPG